VFIDPRVTDVHAIIYAEKALMSARDSNGDGNIEETEVYGQAAPISMLSNQLYIFGSVFSENTI